MSQLTSHDAVCCMCVAVWCTCVAVCCSVLHVCCSVLHGSSVLQCVARVICAVMCHMRFLTSDDESDESSHFSIPRTQCMSRTQSVLRCVARVICAAMCQMHLLTSDDEFDKRSDFSIPRTQCVCHELNLCCGALHESSVLQCGTRVC